MRYGLPYQGSKNKLAERIVDLLPSANRLYDLFAGGCAVSHCALMSGKWEHIHINDITDSVVLFDNALKGNIPDGSEWISREEFYKRKDTDPYVRIIWSFSNNQTQYLYGRDIEPYKKAVHEMIFAPTPNECRLKFKEVCRLMHKCLVVKKNGRERPADHAAMERSQRLLTDFSRRNLPPPPKIKRLHYLQSNESYQRLLIPTRADGAGSASGCRPRNAGGGLVTLPFAAGSIRRA